MAVHHFFFLNWWLMTERLFFFPHRCLPSQQLSRWEEATSSTILWGSKMTMNWTRLSARSSGNKSALPGLSLDRRRSAAFDDSAPPTSSLSSSKASTPAQAESVPTPTTRLTRFRPVPSRLFLLFLVLVVGVGLHWLWKSTPCESLKHFLSQLPQL